ncbi:hypothetical protein P7H12_08990 [Paenibacillus larvae]|nr:hypothetical protein [Paenibacillus larvae]MDT2263693.1 hypothetical protein [Paenibacillus larvae]
MMKMVFVMRVEVNGYYVKNNIAVFPWPKEGSQEEKELIKQGFKKFVCNHMNLIRLETPIRIWKKQVARLIVQFTSKPGILLLRHIPVLQLAWKN